MSKAVPLTSEFLLLSIFKKFGISSPFLALPVYIYIILILLLHALTKTLKGVSLGCLAYRCTSK